MGDGLYGRSLALCMVSVIVRTCVILIDQCSHAVKRTTNEVYTTLDPGKSLNFLQTATGDDANACQRPFSRNSRGLAVAAFRSKRSCGCPFSNQQSDPHSFASAPRLRPYFYPRIPIVAEIYLTLSMIIPYVGQLKKLRAATQAKQGIYTRHPTKADKIHFDAPQLGSLSTSAKWNLTGADEGI